MVTDIVEQLSVKNGADRRFSDQRKQPEQSIFFVARESK
jgi:hypothetical protein